MTADPNDKENASPNPPKRAFYDGSADDEDGPQYFTTAKERYGPADDDLTADLLLSAGPPSSPFQDAGRDDTVDMYRLREMQASKKSRVSSPRKFHDDIYVDENRLEADRDDDATVPAVVVQDVTELSESHQESSIRMTDVDGHSAIRHGPIESSRLDVGSSMMEDRRNEGMSTVGRAGGASDDQYFGNEAMISGVGSEMYENDPMDDTCFSTFSAVPNVDMTMFAKLRASPTKKALPDIVDSPARASRASPYRSGNPSTPTTVRRRRVPDSDLSPTPRKMESNHDDTMNLLDFTDSVNYFHRVSQRFSTSNGRISSPRRHSPLKGSRESIRTPGQYNNLLDFDIPPAPTPRSIPTITPRELESLKSGFLSEISSLRATLSGKEAEVASLKQAVADAERRVGEALEEVRSEAIRKEALEVQQAEWERRGKEMESVLREVRSEIIEGERERERLTKKGEDAEKVKEQHEGRIVELESQLDAARKAAAAAPATASSDSSNRGTITAEESAKEVQDAVEKVARELHTLYKGKHETKVAALKKSYEARWEKRVREAETKLKDAAEEIERLKTERDTTMSGPVNPNASMMGRDSEELEADKRVLEAQIKGLQQEMVSMKHDNECLHSELKMERTEKGELVAAVDEWLTMQQHGPQSHQMQTFRESSISSGPSLGGGDQESTPGETAMVTETAESAFKRSVSRGGLSGIRPPSAGVEKKSRAGMYANAGHSRTNSGSGRSGIALPTPSSNSSSSAGRSGIMSSIERMGRGGL